MASEWGCTVAGISSQCAAHSGARQEVKKGRALRQEGEGEETAEGVNRGHAFGEYQ